MPHGIVLCLESRGTHWQAGGRGAATWQNPAATWQDFGTSLLVRLAEASLRAPAHCFDPVKDFMPGIGQELGPWPGLQSQRQL